MISRGTVRAGRVPVPRRPPSGTSRSARSSRQRPHAGPGTRRSPGDCPASGGGRAPRPGPGRRAEGQTGAVESAAREGGSGSRRTGPSQARALTFTANGSLPETSQAIALTHTGVGVMNRLAVTYSPTCAPRIESPGAAGPELAPSQQHHRRPYEGPRRSRKARTIASNLCQRAAEAGSKGTDGSLSRGQRGRRPRQARLAGPRGTLRTRTPNR